MKMVVERISGKSQRCADRGNLIVILIITPHQSITAAVCLPPSSRRDEPLPLYSISHPFVVPP